MSRSSLPPKTDPRKLEIWRAYYRRHPKKFSARERARRAADPEREKARVRQYHAAHRVEQRAKSRAWKARNRAAIVAYQRKWREANRGVLAAHQRKRDAIQLQAMPPWVDPRQLVPIYQQAARLGLQVDHVYPLRGGTFSGLHVPWNLQLLSASANSRKKNRVTAAMLAPVTLTRRHISATIRA